jgi:hypothetical protein
MTANTAPLLVVSAQVPREQREACLEAAVRWRLIRENSASSRAGTHSHDGRRIVPFEPEEVERIADELGNVFGPLVVVAAYTGLRPSEWAALEWRDVDPRRGRLARRARVLQRRSQDAEDEGQPETRAVACAGVRSARDASQAARHEAHLLRPPRQPHRLEELAQARVAAGARGRRVVDAAAQGAARSRTVPAPVQPQAQLRCGASRPVSRRTTWPGTWARARE